MKRASIHYGVVGHQASNPYSVKKMTSTTATVRVVSKEKYDQQHFFDLPLNSLPPLSASSVRIQSRLLGLGSNNLSYCAIGEVMRWWDAFHVPSSIPAPYNDEAQYGIAPGWGYGEVLESTIPLLRRGMMLYGFLPMSAHPVDLELKQSNDIDSHWLEVSESRQTIMSLYKRYVVAQNPLSSANKVVSAYESTIVVWNAGYCLNRFCFPSRPGDPVISPGPDMGVPWPAGSEKLESTLVISLGAGSKTSRGFVHQLLTNRAPGSGPKGLLEVSSVKKSIVPGLKPVLAHQIVTNSEALSSDTLSWVKSLRVDRIVVCDFGSRDNIVEKLTLLLRDQLENIQVDLIIIGGESKTYTSAELTARMEQGRRLKGLQMNTSGMIEQARKHLGDSIFFEQYASEFQRVIDSELARNKDTVDEGSVLGVKLVWKEGLRGVNGMEEAWTDVAHGKVPGNEGLVISL